MGLFDRIESKKQALQASAMNAIIQAMAVNAVDDQGNRHFSLPHPAEVAKSARDYAQAMIDLENTVEEAK